MEHRQDARLDRVEDEVVDAKIAMRDGGGVFVSRNVGREPFDQPVHHGIAAHIRVVEILFRPAADLAFEVIARTSEIAETDRLIINHVELCQHAVHRATRPVR